VAFQVDQEQKLKDGEVRIAQQSQKESIEKIESISAEAKMKLEQKTEEVSSEVIVELEKRITKQISDAEEQKLSGSEEELETLKSEKVPKIQPKISQSEQHYESFSNEQPDEIENLKSFQITDNKAKEIQTKPKESEEKIETIGVTEKPHKLERTSRFQSMKTKNIRIKPKQTGEIMEPVEIQNKHEKMEVLAESNCCLVSISMEIFLSFYFIWFNKFRINFNIFHNICSFNMFCLGNI
jgi:hypothetical protein